MNAEVVARAIQTIVVPGVMITTCAILVSGLLAHYALIGERLRACARERSDLLRAADAIAIAGAAGAPERLAEQRLAEIDAQVAELLGRHRLVRDAVLAVYAAISLFLADMFAIALAAAVDATWIPNAVLLLFLIAAAALLAAALTMGMEVRQAHRAAEGEALRAGKTAR